MNVVTKIHKALTLNQCFRGRGSLWPPLSLSVILIEVIGQKDTPFSPPTVTSPLCTPRVPNHTSICMESPKNQPQYHRAALKDEFLIWERR